MGNAPSAESEQKTEDAEPSASGAAKKLVEGVQSSLKQSIRQFDESPSASFLDKLCGPVFEDRLNHDRSYAYSEELSEEDSRTVSDGETSTLEGGSRSRGRGSGKKGRSTESGSVLSQSDYESETTSKGTTNPKYSESFGSEDDSYGIEERERRRNSSNKTKSKALVTPTVSTMSKPLASAFAKRCYFTKSGIGKNSQHYEGLTLTGNVILMLAAAMKLKGCPTICDEDLRRVEQTYPNQFSRLPDELLLSSGWRRISKYCHFSNKPIPDGMPFFHSRKRLHPLGGFYFLLASAVGMIRPIDIEPLSRDTLILLETDYPTQADAIPPVLLENPNEWTLVDKFCFFSGGPINAEEDVYYLADFDGNLIFMLAFLSPSLTPEELYKLSDDNTDEPGLKSVAAVEDVESVYDLTERDFDDLKLYHLGPCRALPPYLLQPQAWSKVLPPHFLAAKHRALIRAQRWEEMHGPGSNSMASSPAMSHLEQMNNPFSPQHNPLTVNVGAPPINSPAAAGLPLGSPQTPGMLSPGMTPASSAFMDAHQRSHLGSPGITSPQSNSNSRQYVSSPVQSQNTGNAYFQGTPPPAPSPRIPPKEKLLSPQESEQSVSHDEESLQREVEEEGAFFGTSRAQRNHQLQSSRGPISPPGYRPNDLKNNSFSKLDPPEDEPPSLSKEEIPDDEAYLQQHSPYKASPPQTVDSSVATSYTQSEIESSPEKRQARPQPASTNSYYSGEGEYYESQDQRTTEQYVSRANYYRNSAWEEHQGGMHGAEVYEQNPPNLRNQMVYDHGFDHPDYHEMNSNPEYRNAPHPDYYYNPDQPDYHPEDLNPNYQQHSDYVHDELQHVQYHHNQQQQMSYIHTQLQHADYHHNQQQHVNYQEEQQHIDYHHPEINSTYRAYPSQGHQEVDPHQAHFSPDRDYNSGTENLYPGKSSYVNQEDYENYVHANHQEEPSMGNSPRSDSINDETQPISPDSYQHDQGNTRKYYKSEDVLQVSVEESPGDSYSQETSQGNLATTPKTDVSRPSEASPQSTAMRTAQELLRRNRAKRMAAEYVSRKKLENDENSVGVDSEVGSEVASSIVSGSSVWTDASSVTDRSSRRALILQMAKARMRQNKTLGESDKTIGPIAEEGSMRSSKLDPTRPGVYQSVDYSEELEVD